MKSIEAIVFDVDGTIVDTSEFIYQAYEHSLVVNGMPSRERSDIASQVGKKLEDCYAFLAPDADFAVMATAHRIFQSDNQHLIQPFIYADVVLENLHNQGRHLALWSSRINIVPSLESAGINTERISVIIDGAMVERPKPHPEGLYMVIGQLGLQPSQVVMVGDAAVDIEAGKEAKTRATIGITHGFGTREELETAGPDVIIDALYELQAVIEKLEERDES